MNMPNRAHLGNRYLRRHRPGAWQKGLDMRSESVRDVDRIEYYSEYFHRLAQKTRIVSPYGTLTVTHSRQTHARKVGQFAQSIARNLLFKPRGPDIAARLGGLDPDVVRAAGAAHDIGHPPFGHRGEDVLDEWCKRSGLDGFEGNAQSYRVATKLEVQPGVDYGMDLTFAVQSALLKYPRFAGDQPTSGLSKKWGVYRSEQLDFDEAAQASPPLAAGVQSLEASLMDFADDMTYALHDFEDFFRLGAVQSAWLPETDFWANDDVPASRLRESETRFSAPSWVASCSHVASYFARPEMRPLLEPFQDRQDQLRALKEFTSHFLTRWLGGVDFSPENGLLVPDHAWHEVNVLKQMTWDRVIARPSLGLSQVGQGHLVGTLADALLDILDSAVEDDRLQFCPTRLWELYLLCERDTDWLRADPDRSEVSLRARAVADYISWLTEAQAESLFRRLTGAALDVDPVGGWLR